MKKELALVGFLLLLAIFLFIEPSKLVEILSKTNPLLLATAIAFALPTILTRSVKWHLMLKAQGHVFPFFKVFKYYWIGIGLGQFTPGRLGDIAKAFFVNKKINSLSLSFASVLVDRLIDLCVVFALGSLSAIAFLYLFEISIISLPLIALLLACLVFGFYLLFNKPLLKKLLKPFYRALVPEKFKQRFGKGFDSFLSEVQLLLRKPFLLSFSAFFSLLSWFSNALTFYFIALSLGLELSPLFLLLAMALSNLVLILPISFSGIGTRDGLLILLFSVQSLSPETAVAFSFLVLFTSTTAALIGVALLATERLSLKDFLSDSN